MNVDIEDHKLNHDLTSSQYAHAIMAKQSQYAYAITGESLLRNWIDMHTLSAQIV
jgi:hypothetical protein